MKWGRANFADYPWRHESDPWFALLAEVLLQRTRASTVSRVYPDLKTRFPTPRALADADPSAVREVLGGLGLTWRLPLLQRLADEIARMGRVPTDERVLRGLPGVGAYVAAAYRSLHCGERSVLIDANVVRWLCRMTGRPMDGETRRKRWVLDLADELTPRRAFRDYNYAVLDFTMRVCAQPPVCERCPVREFCVFGRRPMDTLE